MILYYLIAPWVYLLSYLPSGVLYKIADFLAFILRDVIRYRRKIIINNLTKSFPEKSQSELKAIANEFYTHLADRVVENIKCFTISEAELAQRCTLDEASRQLLLNLYQQGKNVTVLLSHTGAWEYAGLVANKVTPFSTYAIYSPIKNKHINNLILETRGRHGMQLVSMTETARYFKQGIDKQTMHLFIADQSPSNPGRAYWTDFMHQDTPFMNGGGKYAVAHNTAAIYCHVKQVKRGYYTMYVELIREDAADSTANEITQGFATLLQKQLQENPSDWLWSHKRWKWGARK